MNVSTFEVKDCDSLDAMNFLNIMTEDEFYIRHHLTEYEHFKHLSREKKFKSLINESISINGNTMLSPYLTLVISSVPNFDCMDVKTLLGDKNLLKSFFSNTIYFNLDSWEKREKLFDNTLELITILESHYFFEYWRENKKALIIEKCLEMSKYISKYNVFDEINNMLGPQSKIENITLYLCSFASPHGIKLADTSYISDISYPLETTLGIAIHEMFHPPYKIKELNDRFNSLKKDSLIHRAFEEQKERYGYTTIEGFIEENVVEAMALLICEKIGLEKDPYLYFLNHDGGSHVFSIILLDYLKRFPKEIEETFQDYFNKLLTSLPIGEFDKEISRIKEEMHI